MAELHNIQPTALVGVVHIRVIEPLLSKDFYVSDDLFRRRTPNLADVLQERDGGDCMVEVNDVDIETFRIFLKWLVLDSDPKNNIFGPLHTNPLGGHYWTSGMPLIKLYILGSNYDIPQLAADALRRFESLVELSGHREHIFAVDINVIPTFDEVGYVYEHTAADSPLRSIIVNAVCNGKGSLDYGYMNCSREFLIDVIFQYDKEKHTWQNLMRYLGMGDGELRTKRKRRLSDVGR